MEKYIMVRAALDSMIYGGSFVYIGERKWYNPIRWIFGKQYCKMVSQKDIYK